MHVSSLGLGGAWDFEYATSERDVGWFVLLLPAQAIL